MLQIFKVDWIICDFWLTFIENFISENKKEVAEKKELDNLVSTLRGKKLELYKLYMKNICNNILQVIKLEVKSVDSHNMI